MHESWEDNINKEKLWEKINIDRKMSSYIEKDCLKNNRTIATQVTGQQN
jgi:hypothetical protein